MLQLLHHSKKVKAKNKKIKLESFAAKKVKVWWMGKTKREDREEGS